MTQYYCDVEDLFDVPPESFRPAPKVMSSIVRIVPRQEPIVEARSIPLLERVVKMAFQQRRKTLRNCLKPITETLTDATLLNVDLSKRAEQLSVIEFVELSNKLHQLTNDE